MVRAIAATKAPSIGTLATIGPARPPSRRLLLCSVPRGRLALDGSCSALSQEDVFRPRERQMGGYET